MDILPMRIIIRKPRLKAVQEIKLVDFPYTKFQRTFTYCENTFLTVMFWVGAKGLSCLGIF
jgi:hypothetical protein